MVHNSSFVGKYKNLVVLAVLLIALAVIALNFPLKQQKQVAIEGFSFADFVDEELNYIPNNGKYFVGETMEFVFQLSNLSMQGNFVSYRVEAEIENLVPGGTQKTFSETLLEETVPIKNSDGKISVAGKIQLYADAKTGTSILKITATDKLSGQKKSIEKVFVVEEWPEQIVYVPSLQ